MIPLLDEHYNPQLSNSLSQLADIISQEADWQRELSYQLWEQVVSESADGLVLHLPTFYQFHAAAQRRLVKAICGHLTGAQGWEKKDIDSIIRLGQSQGSSRYLGLKQGLMVYKVYQQLQFTTHRRRNAAFSYDFSVPGEITIKETGETVSCSLLPGEQYSPHSTHTVLDWDKLEAPLVLRSRMPGDRFTPPGTSRSTKLKEYYIERKIPWEERERIPLLVSAQGTVYALVGHESGEEARATSQSRYILVIKRERLQT